MNKNNITETSVEPLNENNLKAGTTLLATGIILIGIAAVFENIYVFSAAAFCVIAAVKISPIYQLEEKITEQPHSL